MEQLQQLIGIRDAAEKRLEAARAAIERSPDAKLVASLSLLIDDLRASFEAEAGSSGVATEADPVQPAAPEPSPEPEPVAEAPSEAIESAAPEGGAPADPEPPASDPFSLEDSLEAELFKVDDGKL